MSFLYNIQKKLFTFIGNIQYYGWKHPFWFSVSAPGYQLKGEHYRIVRPLLQPGDIVLQRFEGWVDKWFIPGFWNHAAIYIGNKEEQVVHAVSEGVLIEDIINFMRTDHMIILRSKDTSLANDAISKAIGIVGCEYDFSFDFSNNVRFACTEVVDYCYDNQFFKTRRLFRDTLTPDDIASSGLLEVVWDSRKFSVVVNDVGFKASAVGKKSSVMMRSIMRRS